MKQQRFKIEDQNLPRKGSVARKLISNGIYGGDIQYRKLKRPLSITKSIHTIFKMNDLSYKKTGGFRKETAFINRKLLEFSNKFLVECRKHSINSNHIHLLCKIDNKEDFG